ncbi:MAG: Uma2 family endonuclease [Proteobacteria bacterium]|nr:Uma2 family endonuclease [Pseudomonadota bacterium]
MPSFEHGDLQGELRIRLRSCEKRRGGRWWFSSECEVEFALGERYLPDLAGWDSARVAERPTGARVRTPPQWVCEILSPSTANRDLGDKKATYHDAHVDHYWLLDPEAKTLTVLGWTEHGYRTLLTAGDSECVHAAPFDAIELNLRELFG